MRGRGLRATFVVGVVACLAVAIPAGTANAAGQPSRAECQAAGHILLRSVSGKKIFEDYTWPGSPRVVNDQNDEIMRDGLIPVLTACAGPAAGPAGVRR